MCHPTRLFGLSALCAVLLAASCVELTGQRISIFHDSSRDQLLVLLHHDGIHEGQIGRSADGLEQIPAYAEHGDVMLLDWPFHVQFEELKQASTNEGTPPALRALAREALTSVKSQLLGRYRDLDGRIGAAQLVVISGVKGFLEKANAAISEAFLAAGPSEEWPRTLLRLREASASRRQWISLDGHSIVLSFPAHPLEWARGKSRILAQVAEEVEEIARKRGTAGGSDLEIGILAQIVGLSPLSLTEAAGEVTVRLGDSRKPATFRFLLHNEYSRRLEDVVTRKVPTELDPAIAAALLDPRSAEGADLRQRLEWGPSEEAVRAILNLVSSAEKEGESAHAAKRKLSVERLQTWARAETDSGRILDAPAFTGNEDAYLMAWRSWYGRAVTFPWQPRQP